ncbi:hypothetical protein [Fusobacterium periodonticum]|uniref:hypothetical protein n=1 Tax=Fusobacterium periodonticum TaxID=860 RepID=UPI0028D16C60|nr:hypothetical protein [Fusobacterium periodonticum]
MAIIKMIKRESAYVTIDKTGIEDAKLSWAATGLLTYLIGRPANWQINITHLSGVKLNGERSTRNALLELREANYCHYFEIRKKGRVAETIYLVFEIPTNYEEAIKNYIDLKEGEQILYKRVFENDKKEPKVRNEVSVKSIENKEFSPKLRNAKTVNAKGENEGLINIDTTNKRNTNKKTTTAEEDKNTKNSSSFLEKFSIGKEVEKEEINQKLISLSFSKMTRKNIIKLYSKNLVDKNRIFEVLEFSKDKNWGEGAVYSALKENWNTKKVENKETKQIEMRKANEEKEREKRLEREKEEEKIRKNNERIDNTIKEFKKLPEAKQIEITTIAEERYINKNKVNKDFFDMVKKNTPLLYLNILFSELIELLKEKNYSFAFATV